MARPEAGPNLGRSIWAVVAGSLLVVILSLGTDEILHLIHVYPPWGQPMFQPGLNALALAYRMVFAVLGNLLGAAAAIRANVGPIWYPVALAFSAFPCAWVTQPTADGLGAVVR